VTRKICRDVGIDAEHIVLGSELRALDDDAVGLLASNHGVFAKLTPDDKTRIVRALKSRGHTVGFLGDGINDAGALREADVGVSVDSAVDIAKESADIILLEKSLLVLEEGVIEGRKTFGNTIKYIKMTASSNFGNVFSVLVASAFLPFLPMLPIQLLTNNLLYDFSQTSIPWDDMDPEYIHVPRQWRADDIGRFMVFIGPISSIFDYLTFFLMLYVFNCRHTQPGSVPHRLVRGVAFHPDVDHPCHSHQQNPVHPKPGQLAAHPDLVNHRRGRCLADSFASGEHARICPAFAAVLAVFGHHAAGLCNSDTGGEDLVYSPVWPMMAGEGRAALNSARMGLSQSVEALKSEQGRSKGFVAYS
jgi:hypothetical protein